ncbi:MAG: hypothetical protein FJ125_15000, partial [Deltaproteobacteria bacterium]|nr:hypothetical protein [Deltaproteobacteria bacterium]
MTLRETTRWLALASLLALGGSCGPCQGGGGCDDCNPSTGGGGPEDRTARYEIEREKAFDGTRFTEKDKLALSVKID